MNYVTEKGFYLDGAGGMLTCKQAVNSMMQARYNPDIHGLPVPLAKKERSKLKIG